MMPFEYYTIYFCDGYVEYRKYEGSRTCGGGVIVLEIPQGERKAVQNDTPPALKGE